MSKKNRVDEDSKEQIRKLKDTVKRRDKTIRQLKSQIKTLEQSWRTTEVYLKEVTDGKPLSEVIKDIESNKPLGKCELECPSCASKNMKKILFTGFYIISCQCGYRKKIDDEQEIIKKSRAK
jgi:hypothetical protein